MGTPDYIEKLGATLRWERGRCRILYRDHNAVFARLKPADLREKFNEAMHRTVEHFARMSAAGNANLTLQQLEDLSFGVALYWLYVYNMWRHTYPQHKEHPLRVEQAELQHPESHDRCWHFCEKEFGPDYIRYAAALTGMTSEQFRTYERGRREFFDR